MDMLSNWSQDFDDLLRGHCRLLEAGDAIASDAPLSLLGIDSLEVIELIVEIEDRFSFSVPDSLLTPEIFASPGSIWRAISPLIANQEDTSGGSHL